MQPETRGADKEAYWQPTPKSGELSIIIRLYALKTEALDGRWIPPAIGTVKG
jgi:hypothetical protein